MTDEDRDETGREPDGSATERAEELVDRVAQGASYLASLAFLRLLRGASIAREEAEDIWAEAQSLRRREGQGGEPDAGGEDVAAPGEVRRAAATAAGTAQQAAQQAGHAVGVAAEAARRKAEELGLTETPTIKVTEAARRKAEELGVALAGLQGTGAGGQITVEDVKKRAKAERP